MPVFPGADQRLAHQSPNRKYCDRQAEGQHAKTYFTKLITAKESKTKESLIHRLADEENSDNVANLFPLRSCASNVPGSPCVSETFPRNTHAFLFLSSQRLPQVSSLSVFLFLCFTIFTKPTASPPSTVSGELPCPARSSFLKTSVVHCPCGSSALSLGISPKLNPALALCLYFWQKNLLKSFIL